VCVVTFFNEAPTWPLHPPSPRNIRSDGILLNSFSVLVCIRGEEEDDDENVTKLHPGNGCPFFTEKAPMGAFSVKNGTGCNFVTFSVARCRLYQCVKSESFLFNYYTLSVLFLR
jgi:hypothetical protein